MLHCRELCLHFRVEVSRRRDSAVALLYLLFDEVVVVLRKAIGFVEMRAASQGAKLAAGSKCIRSTVVAQLY